MAFDRHGYPPRLRGWDHSAAAPYFVTFTVACRVPSLGVIDNGTVKLSRAGKVVRNCWLELPVRFPPVKLDEMVVMPDHVHGIVILCGPLINQRPTPPLANHGSTPLLINQGPTRAKGCTLQPMMADPRLLLGKVIRAWKAASTRQIRQLGDPAFAWQSRYYEHVVRSERALHRIRAYVASNPARVGRD